MIGYQKYLTLQDITKRYKETTALDRVSFDVFKGEIFGFIGPNGAGKTTIIKILVGLINTFKGNYKINNNSPTNIHRELGYMPQSVSFQNWRTVDNVFKTFGKISGLDDTFIENQIVKITELLELKEVRYRNISKLSGGMIQKLGLAQALLNNPNFLVLDEPLSGLDPTSRYELKKIIKNLSQEGTTVFFSSHILSDVQDIADRIAILNKGRILTIGNPVDLTTDLYQSHIIGVTFFDNFNDLKLLKSFKAIESIEQKNSKSITIHLKIDSDLKSLTQGLIKKLVDKKYNIQSFGKITPNLDEVYLKYIKGN